MRAFCVFQWQATISFACNKQNINFLSELVKVHVSGKIFSVHSLRHLGIFCFNTMEKKVKTFSPNKIKLEHTSLNNDIKFLSLDCILYIDLECWDYIYVVIPELCILS